ncbi:MAG: alpha-L-arabinofuranosidase-like protein [Ferruginibacter sp.]|nr:alpha-L-arabinofuranosidase-like protein [Ferruginibacter sp.]
MNFSKMFTAPLSMFLLLAVVGACKKTPPTPDPGGGTGPVPVTPTPITPAIDPAIANTIGFFLDDWQPKTFIKPAFTETAAAGNVTTTVTADASSIITKIPLSEFGQNGVWWMGPAITVPSAVTNITNLHPHIIRFPGGSSSDAYFWNSPEGVIPPDVPARIKDKDYIDRDPFYNYGKTTLNWKCSLDNYYSLLQQTNNQGIITINFGYSRYGTSANPVATAAHLAADWVRYDNGRTKYWEIGNENYGDWEWGYRINTSLNKDGQPEILTGAQYAKHFKVFADSMKKAATEIGKTIYIGAVAVETAPEAWQTNTVKTWNAGMMTGVNNKADFYVGHNYFTPYDQNSNAAVVLSSALTVPAQMMNYITQTLQTNGAIVKPVVMDEWNMWAKDSKQQVSNTSGIFAVLVMGEAIKNKYGMSARWDMMNGWDNGNDHGLFSADDEPGMTKWSPRPSFYYLYFFQRSLGDRLVASTVQGSADIKAYASTYSSGEANVTVINMGASAQSVEIKINNFNIGSRYYWYSLEGSNDNGEFSRKVLVNSSGPATVAGGPADYATLKARSAVTTNGVKVTVPPLGTVIVMIEK